jgi:hypothetical protein
MERPLRRHWRPCPMDMTTLTLSLIFGSLGMGFFMYGKNTGAFITMGIGLALMIFPYFIPNAIAMTIVGGLLSVVPFVIRES